MSDDWFEKEQLHFAAADGDLQRVKKLIGNGYDVNAFDEHLAQTPLHYAAREEHIEVVDYLISAGAQINAHVEEKIGETPLGKVAASCSYELAQKLISVGANPTIPGGMGITALDRAKKRKKPEGVRVYELLLSTAKNRFHYDA